MSREESGIMYGVQMPYMQNVLLRDEPAWRVHLRLGSLVIPGTAYFTNDAKLIISDWCFRETPDGKGETEMFHGKRNKLDILAWVAGPCADRFLANGGQEMNMGEGKKRHAVHSFVRLAYDNPDRDTPAKKDLALKLLDTAAKIVDYDSLVSAMKDDKAGVYMFLSDPSRLFRVHGTPQKYGDVSFKMGADACLYLSAQPVIDRGAWSHNFPLPGLYLSEQIANLIFGDTP